MVTLADCQRTQHAWFRALAEATGGRSFSTHRMDWVWLPGTRQMLCLFPTDITESGLAPALAEAERRGAESVGVWMNASVRAGILPQWRFERGWQPWWMTRALDVETVAAASESDDARINVSPAVENQVWFAAAHHGQEAVGSAYAYCPPEQGSKHLAGIFDLYVNAEHRRTGMGTAMVNKLSEAAFNAGAEHLLLHATPDGQRLFRNLGFELIGKGQTWWFHLPAQNLAQ
ncbi:GNAT family N-acetyltransferase [Specibacter sp. NPDC057265]|uniref:GNAT family N-acetyltransferase n=1 Tax=Specibacter sp. NPDC057265 TaxID=3346075 RepID=UPI0036280528